MTSSYLVEPDLDFIAQIKSGSGPNLKKCYQCATCSVVCTISPDDSPFPRKEMIHAAWGLKERLMANPDIWLCHNCGDCSQYCPRGARPGDVLGALRKLSIKEYSKPAFLHRLLNDMHMLPLLIIIPALILLAVGMTTGMLNLSPGGKQIVFARFFPVPLIEMIFIPLSLGAALVFFLGIKRFIRDMQAWSVNEKRPVQDSIDLKVFFATLAGQLPDIIRHGQFSNCSGNKSRKFSHMMVSFSFISLAFVAGAFVFALYVLNSHGPYAQVNPVKILANISGVALILGSLIMIRDRWAADGQFNTYFDWYLLGLAFFLGITGMLTQILRLAEIPWAAYSIYFIHLIFAFNLLAFLPYTKLAHLVYRTFAIAYYHYSKGK